MPFPQTAEKIENERKIENKEYLQTQLKLRLQDFETVQNIQREQQLKKKHLRTLVDTSGVGLETNNEINLTDWMATGNHNIGNELKLLDSVQQNVNEIMKTINESRNNFKNNDDDDDDDDDDDNVKEEKKEIGNMYIVDDYLYYEIDFKSDIKITNLNDDWEIE